MLSCGRRVSSSFCLVRSRYLLETCGWRQQSAIASARRCTVEEATHVDLVGFDLVAGRHRRGLFSIGHDATTMLHAFSNLTGNSWHKDQKQESRCKS